ncbi:hypothetical protein MAPG_09405 [Magnaporthiopsis poae ATCC 64411]|uniref:Uncharacterized protein n=1 Tax=Magnaporthiopsis poae (strain ATCC 64411 / 73-15) TaxID=644358 RepID=A0A0C4E9V5_MAGP6|nr:hypothetical protein MAPG_09405 [Magnaporthiopsis poae ATCC 64411]
MTISLRAQMPLVHIWHPSSQKRKGKTLICTAPNPILQGHGAAVALGMRWINASATRELASLCTTKLRGQDEGGKEETATTLHLGHATQSWASEAAHTIGRHGPSRLPGVQLPNAPIPGATSSARSSIFTRTGRAGAKPALEPQLADH